MKKEKWLISIIILLFWIQPVFAGDWHFPLGLTYISGFYDIVDIYEDNLEEEGYLVDTVEAPPLGISFHPYFQFLDKFAIGCGIGPLMYIDGDVVEFFALPFSLDGRYFFLKTAGTGLYLRAGVKKYFASGDYVEDSTPGFFGGLGLELLKNKKVNMGFEVLVDYAEIEFEDLKNDDTKDICPNPVIVSVFVIF